jgi:hypothetical protein
VRPWRGATAAALRLCGWVLAPSLTLAEESTADKTARAKVHFKAGESHFSLGEFGRALEEYRRAYLLKPLPPLLFNMAQCHRHLGDLERATFLLRRFLSFTLTAEQRSQAEAVLREVETASKRKPSLGVPPPTSTPSTARRPSASTARRPSASTSSQGGAGDGARVPSHGTSTLAKPPEAAARQPFTPLATPVVRSVSVTRTTPLYKRWWFWTVVGGAALATATTIGVLASRGDDLPRGSLPPVDYR